MKATGYICIKQTSKYAARYPMRLTKSSPSLAGNEIAIKFAIEIPDQIFEKPMLQANITIPQEAVSKPIIDATIVDNVEQIIKQNLGIDVRLEVVEKDPVA